MACLALAEPVCPHPPQQKKLRREFLELGFKYDNLLMEESAQILEIETFIPMLLQVRRGGGEDLWGCPFQQHRGGCL